LDLRRADGYWARLLGLAGLRAVPRGQGLLLPGTRSVHTFGMRFALDLVWLDGEGRVLRVDRAVGPGQLVRCAGASGVVEVVAGESVVAGLVAGARVLCSAPASSRAVPPGESCS